MISPILTAMPNYPGGEIFEEYRNRFLVKDEHAGIKVIRTWIYATEEENLRPTPTKLFLVCCFFPCIRHMEDWLTGHRDR